MLIVILHHQRKARLTRSNMEIQELFKTCSEITKSKGFDVSRHCSQLLLMASEIAEALEEVSPAMGKVEKFKRGFSFLMNDFENFRQNSKDAIDHSDICNPEHYLEEIADLQIRIASYIGGLNLTDDFIDALTKKIEVNRNRPMLHGKGF